MNRAQTLEWERRWALAAAIGAFAAAILFVVSTVVRGDALVGDSSTVEALRDFHENRGALLLAAILKAVALIALTVPLYYLFKAASARSESVRPGLIGVVIAGPLFLAALDVLFWLAVDPAATEFVTPPATGGGVPIGEYAQDLVEGRGLLSVYQGVALAGPIGFTFAVVYTALWGMRVGLLTRFIGTLGMALGVAQILIPFMLVALMVWVAWVGLIFLDRIPGGRPPAWAAGEAIPWPKAGEQPPEAREAPDEAIEGEAIEGEATELAGDAESPNVARRERAKRRKRKRRRG
jgi:hypothetical protein